MTTTYYCDPFRGLVEGVYTIPEEVVLPPGRPFMVLSIMDLATVKQKTSPVAYAEMVAAGVTRQGKIRGTDGTEYYVRVIEDARCEIRMTGFTGPTFKPTTATTTKLLTTEPNDMTRLERYKKTIATIYQIDPEESETAQQILDSLAECPTFATVQRYLSTFWDKASLAQLLEDFFAEEE